MNNQTVINTTGEPINEAPVVDTLSTPTTSGNANIRPLIPDVTGTTFEGRDFGGRDIDFYEYLYLYYVDFVFCHDVTTKLSVITEVERSEVLKRLDQRFPGYPENAVIFRVNNGYTDVVVALPFSNFPDALKEADWFVAYNPVGRPVALVSLLTYEAKVSIRFMTRVFCSYSCAFFVDGRLCYDDADFDDNYNLGWFPLTPDNQAVIEGGNNITTGTTTEKDSVNQAPSITHFLGVYCKPIRNLAEAWHISEDLLSDRLKAHIEPCVAVLTTDYLELAYIGLDDKARYKLPWSELPVTARQIIEHYRPDLIDLYDKHNPTGKYEPRIINKEDNTNE